MRTVRKHCGFRGRQLRERTGQEIKGCEAFKTWSKHNFLDWRQCCEWCRHVHLRITKAKGVDFLHHKHLAAVWVADFACHLSLKTSLTEWFCHALSVGDKEFVMIPTRSTSASSYKLCLGLGPCQHFVSSLLWQHVLVSCGFLPDFSKQQSIPEGFFQGKALRVD